MKYRNRFNYSARRDSWFSSGYPWALLLIIAIGGALFWWSLHSQCNKLGTAIGQNQSLKQNMLSELTRAEGMWENCKTPEKLTQALIEHGLVMSKAKPEQIVKMDQHGQPIPGQLALQKFSRSSQNTGKLVKSSTHR